MLSLLCGLPCRHARPVADHCIQHKRHHHSGHSRQRQRDPTRHVSGCASELQLPAASAACSSTAAASTWRAVGGGAHERLCSAARARELLTRPPLCAAMLQVHAGAADQQGRAQRGQDHVCLSPGRLDGAGVGLLCALNNQPMTTKPTHLSQRTITHHSRACVSVSCPQHFDQ